MAGQVYILDRYVYDAKVQNGTIQSGSMYIVREPSSANPNMLSLYVGLARQADICDVTDILSVDFNDPLNNYNIPEAYHVPNKLLLSKRQKDDGTSFYQCFMWDGEQFIQCLGEMNNVNVVNTLPATGVDEQVYILVSDSATGIFVWENGDYIRVDKSLIPDDVTILKDANNIISGVGANVTGNSYTVGGTSYTAGISAEIFNYVADPSDLPAGAANNIAVGKASSASGLSNVVLSDYAHIEGYNNKESGIGNNFLHIEGTGNTITSGNTASHIEGYGNSIGAGGNNFCHIQGYQNSITGGGNTQITITGKGNTVSGNSLKTFEIHGENNTVATNGDYLGFVFGQNNTIAQSSSGVLASSIFGNYNNIEGPIVTSMVVGLGNNPKAGSLSTNCLFLGANHVHYGVAYATIFAGSGHQTLASTGIQDSIVFGSNNTLDGVNRSIIGGSGTTASNVLESIIVGNNLHSNSGNNIPQAIFGTNNYYQGSVPYLLCVGNGGKNALQVDTNGKMIVEGNIVCGTGVSLSTVRNYPTGISADDAHYPFQFLPFNGSETVLSENYTVADITIASIASMQAYDQDDLTVITKSTTGDYSCILIFKKSSNLTDISNAITNFKANDSTKIYLMNPDLDISNYDIIHIMIFNDGFHLCAIASGYEV